MELSEIETTLGIEIEFYGNESDAKRSIRDMQSSGLEVCGDASLGNLGVEIRFDKGVPIKDSMERINLMHRIVTGGTNIAADFVTTFHNSFIPAEVASTVTIAECDEDYCFGQVGRRHGTTGLHIHLGMPAEYSWLDILALSDYLEAHDEEVRALSWRDSPVWAKNTKGHGDRVRELHHDIMERIRCASASTDLVTSSSTVAAKYPRLQLNHDKYMGMNIRNVGSGINTLEFRYADTVLLADMPAFERYLKFLTNAYNEHMINRTEYRISDNCTLKEVTRKQHENNLATVTIYDALTNEGQRIYRAHTIR